MRMPLAITKKLATAWRFHWPGRGCRDCWKEAIAGPITPLRRHFLLGQEGIEESILHCIKAHIIFWRTTFPAYTAWFWIASMPMLDNQLSPGDGRKAGSQEAGPLLVSLEAVLRGKCTLKIPMLHVCSIGYNYHTLVSQTLLQIVPLTSSSATRVHMHGSISNLYSFRRSSLAKSLTRFNSSPSVFSSNSPASLLSSNACLKSWSCLMRFTTDSSMLGVLHARTSISTCNVKLPNGTQEM